MVSLGVVFVITIGQLEKVNTSRSSRYSMFLFDVLFLVPSTESWLQFVLEVGG